MSRAPKTLCLLWTGLILGLVWEAYATTAPKSLSFQDFIQEATASDHVFERILLEELALSYRRTLAVSSMDLLISLKHDHAVTFAGGAFQNAPNTSLHLSTLFPMTGSELSADYQVTSPQDGASRPSQVSVSFTQSIAKNAFGSTTRLLDRIAGLETTLARHQIVEAYEDYLSTVMQAYYTWHEANQNLRIGEESYQENLKLLSNIHRRAQQGIALPIDINKVELEVLSRKERFLDIQERHQNSMHIIQKIIGREVTSIASTAATPMNPLEDDFDALYERFRQASRTSRLLKTMEAKSALEVKRDAQALLPSLDLSLAYRMRGADYTLSEPQGLPSLGLSFAFPLGRKHEKARLELSKIDLQRQRLESTNVYRHLHAQLKTLYQQIQKQKQRIDIDTERIRLARLILDDETQNYSLGRVTLNDYIRAFNNLDTYRFRKIAAEAEYRRLLVEWLRLTDMLITQEDIQR